MIDYIPSTNIHKINASENTKEYSNILNIIKDLVNNGFKRNNKLIAIGGGVIQDTTSFIASILYRGVDWVLFPTTLLSQGDSCIGSKTSINLGNIKNLVGNFYPPNNIIIDINFLKTLPDKEIISGIGEMCHYFLIDGRESFDYFKNSEVGIDLIYKSLMIKKKMVEIDEFDRKERKIFNYGHTFGHAIESITNYKIPHGVAVSYGMSISNYVSMKLDYITSEEFYEMDLVLKKIYSTIRLPKLDMGEYMSILKSDKKNEGNKLGLILTRGLGEMFLKQIDPDDIKNYIKEHIYKLTNE